MEDVIGRQQIRKCGVDLKGPPVTGRGGGALCVFGICASCCLRLLFVVLGGSLISGVLFQMMFMMF